MVVGVTGQLFGLLWIYLCLGEAVEILLDHGLRSDVLVSSVNLRFVEIGSGCQVGRTLGALVRLQIVIDIIVQWHARSTAFPRANHTGGIIFHTFPFQQSVRISHSVADLLSTRFLPLLRIRRYSKWILRTLEGFLFFLDR